MPGTWIGYVRSRAELAAGAPDRDLARFLGDDGASVRVERDVGRVAGIEHVGRVFDERLIEGRVEPRRSRPRVAGEGKPEQAEPPDQRARSYATGHEGESLS